MKTKGFITGLFLGLFVALFGAYLMGYTAAIAMPKGLVEYAKESSHWQVIFVLWDFIVVQLLSVGLLSILVTAVAIKFLPGNAWWKGIGIVLGAIGLMYAFSPELFKTLYIGHHLYGVTVILCVVPLSYYLSRKRNA